MPILEEELESTTGKSSFFAIINKKGAVQWTVYNNGKGYIGIYCGDDGKTDVFKESKVKGMLTMAIILENRLLYK